MVNKYTRTIQDTLDLHQHTREEARAAVLAFLAASEKAGYAYVRIITGKGLHSKNAPVLRDYVKSLLDKEGYEFWDAKIQDGGEGAIEVRL